jgi:hypothetical protein
MKMAVFWDVAPCSLVDSDRRFRGDYCSIIRVTPMTHRPDYEGSKHAKFIFFV